MIFFFSLSTIFLVLYFTKPVVVKYSAISFFFSVSFLLSFLFCAFLIDSSCLRGDPFLWLIQILYRCQILVCSCNLLWHEGLIYQLHHHPGYFLEIFLEMLKEFRFIFFRNLGVSIRGMD